jgi:hypothetical protein
MAAGIGPIAEEPDPIAFDPLRMSWWSLPMAVAWIAWRDISLVQKHCAEYRKNCTHWVPGSWNVPIDDGREFERIDGWMLQHWQRSTVLRLSMSEAFTRSTKGLPAAQMTIAEAERQLWEALEAGKLIGVAKEGATGKVFYRHHHSQRKPLAKSRSEKRPTLNVETARNSLSQWPLHKMRPLTPGSVRTIA